MSYFRWFIFTFQPEFSLSFCFLLSLPQAYWGIKDSDLLKMCMVIWYACTLQNEYHSELSNRSITSRSYFFMRVIYPSNKIQVYNIASLTIVTMLHINLKEFIHLMPESLCLLSNISLFPPVLQPLVIFIVSSASGHSIFLASTQDTEYS